MDYKEMYDEMEDCQEPRRKIDGLTWLLIVGVTIGFSLIAIGVYMLLTI